MKTSREPGLVYLAASHHAGTLKSFAASALAAAGSPRPKVAVTYAAAGGPIVARMLSFFDHLFPGADVRRFTVKGEHGAQPAAEARAIVESADVVFFGGGDPVLGARLLVEAGADGWVRAARARGASCLGVSAGAMMLGAWWASWPDEAPSGAPHEGGELVSCTRVVGDLVVDCHAEADQWAELVAVRAMLAERLGDADLPRLVGLPTGAGLIVHAGGTLESVGGTPFHLH
jgi:cyanophycinase-like exopeptidase